VPRIDVELAVRLLSSTDVGDQRSDIARVGAWAEARSVRLDDRRSGDPPIGQAMAADCCVGATSA